MKLLFLLAVLLTFCGAGRKNKHKKHHKNGWQVVKTSKRSHHKSGKPGIRYKVKDDSSDSFYDAQRAPTTGFRYGKGRSDGPIPKGLLGKGDLAIADLEMNGEKMEEGAQRQIINASVGSGWLHFAFGRTDTMSNRHFAIQSARKIVVRVVDLFCTGDRFKVLANIDGKQVTLGTTSQAHSDDCRTTTADPESAWVNSFWSRGEFVLPAGRRYLIMVQVISSSFGGGTGAIHFDYDPDEEESTDPTIYSSTPDDEEEGDSDDEETPPSDESSSSYPSDDDEDDDAKPSKSRSKRKRSHYCCEISGKQAERLTGGAIKRGAGKAKKLSAKEKKKIAKQAKKKATKKTAGSKSSKLPKMTMRLPDQGDPNFLKSLCAGKNGFFIVNIPASGTEIEAVCDHFFGSIPAQLSDSVNVKAPAQETLKKCVGPKATVWIGGHNGHKDQYSYGITLRKEGSIEVRAVEPTILHPVMCQRSHVSS